LVYDGINVVFGNFAMKDDDGEGSEDISYKVFDIDVDTPKDRSITFYGGLKNCTNLAQVDWSYIREKYEEIRDTDDGGGIGPSTADFEASVRQKFSEFQQ
jgi:hypothetical protein